MKYIGRFLLYITIFFFSFSLISVLLLEVVPITVTPLKFIRLFDGNTSFEARSRWTSLSNISPMMVRAVIATEDGNFLEHRGFDFEAIDKAIRNNKRGRKLRGASTISQQTAKNVFCFPDRTWVRKGFETYFTFLIETFWSKRRVMEVYLNVIETNEGVYGVGATAKKFYNKKASKLNVHEASMIATVLPSPIRMNLASPSSYMRSRASRVRGMMNRIGVVDFDNPTKE